MARSAGGGRAAWARPARTYAATTVQVAGLFPFVAGSGAPTAGVPLGRHLACGARCVCADPFAWMAAGLTTNTGMFLLGQPGVGKSALAKRLTLGMAAFGVRPIILGDTKGEHTAIIEALGGQVIRVGRGLDRINPLDPGPLGARRRPGCPGEQARDVRAEIRGRQLTTLMALCALVRGAGGAPVSNGEEVLLGEALDQLTRTAATRSRPCPTLLRRRCASPPPALIGAAEGRTRRDYDDATRELRRTLNLLLPRRHGRRVRRAVHPPAGPGRPRHQRRHLRHRGRRGHPGRRRDAGHLDRRLRHRRRRRRPGRRRPGQPPPAPDGHGRAVAGAARRTRAWSSTPTP